MTYRTIHHYDHRILNNAPRHNLHAPGFTVWTSADNGETWSRHATADHLSTAEAIRHRIFTDTGRTVLCIIRQGA